MLSLLEEPLTLRAFLHVLFSLIEHFRPVVSLVDGFMGKRSTSHVVLRVTIMDLPYHPFGFLWPEAP